MTLNEAARLLEAAGVDSPMHDARALFKEFARASELDLINREYSSDSEELVRAVSRRAEREPLQYIIGRVDFYRESYKVTPDCLIPRPDTEILVDFAVKSIPDSERFADLCCGSGCIGISVLANTSRTECVFADLSEPALALTRENTAYNGVSERATLVCADVLEKRLDGEFFAILSNPPYVTSTAYLSLEPEIYKEPKMAFVGGEDGMDFYRALTPKYKNSIKKDGFIAYEIGYDQEHLISLVAEESSMSCDILRDLCGNARVAVLRNP